MTADFAAQLRIRAAEEAIALPPHLLDKLLIYYQLLQRWNRKLNLTSLSDAAQAVDRLVLEPLAAARHLPHGARLVDLGSGGGSPAIPLALALNTACLLMIESRTRKAAFLREAAREVGLSATVETARFEDVARHLSYAGAFDLASVRAVRVDHTALESAAALLRPRGLVALFRGAAGPDQPEVTSHNLSWRETRPLLRSSGTRLTLLFHVEQSI